MPFLLIYIRLTGSIDMGAKSEEKNLKFEELKAMEEASYVAVGELQ